MLLKSEMRKSLLLKRKEITNKSQKDEKINSLLASADFFQNSSLVLFYAPTNDEIDVSKAILDAFASGKKVAFPKCTDKEGNMQFYLVDSYESLVSGTFGIREPDPNTAELVADFTNALCVVPALSLDERGYRIGYGKGYYDRFLQKNCLTSVALCYNELMSNYVPNDNYDMQVDFIINDKELLHIRK